ncbi:MAG TPA: AI-2E family transporter [Longimicrobiales bacterium]|jgi:predicted PurR-regulated permease PerM
MTPEAKAVLDGGGLRFRRGFLLLLVAGISFLFLLVIQGFLMAVMLAAVFGGLASPLYRWIRARLGGRRVVAGVVSVLVLMGGVGIPVAGFLTLVASEAAQVSQAVPEWIEGNAAHLEQLRVLANKIPFASQLLPQRGQWEEQLQALAARTGPLLMGRLAAATKETVGFILQLFVFLYALFFFLVDGRDILRRILYYVPLSPEQESRLLERFLSVSRATLKGSLLIGMLQGGLAGLAFWATGVPAPALWGTLMVVLSIIPAVGAAIIWVPAVIYLSVQGDALAAVGLLTWCASVVSLVDNFLRPRLVGRDARMSDLLILLSTLGGIALFGAAGFIAGPIVAALFVTIWHIFGEVFHEWLPEVPTGSLLGVDGP